MGLGLTSFGINSPGVPIFTQFPTANQPGAGQSGCTAGTAVCIADIASRTLVSALTVRAQERALQRGFVQQPVLTPGPAFQPAAFFSSENLPVLLLVGLGIFLLVRSK